MLNLDTVLNDPQCWTNPEVFYPERHLNEDGTKMIRSEYFYPFGAGILKHLKILVKDKLLKQACRHRKKNVPWRISSQEYVFSLHGWVN